MKNTKDSSEKEYIPLTGVLESDPDMNKAMLILLEVRVGVGPNITKRIWIPKSLMRDYTIELRRDEHGREHKYIDFEVQKWKAEKDNIVFKGDIVDQENEYFADGGGDLDLEDGELDFDNLEF